MAMKTTPPIEAPMIMPGSGFAASLWPVAGDDGSAWVIVVGGVVVVVVVVVGVVVGVVVSGVDVVVGGGGAVVMVDISINAVLSFSAGYS